MVSKLVASKDTGHSSQLACPEAARGRMQKAATAVAKSEFEKVIGKWSGIHAMK
jgi:hypothetical protein